MSPKTLRCGDVRETWQIRHSKELLYCRTGNERYSEKIIGIGIWWSFIGHRGQMMCMALPWLWKELCSQLFKEPSEGIDVPWKVFGEGWSLVYTHGPEVWKAKSSSTLYCHRSKRMHLARLLSLPGQSLFPNFGPGRQRKHGAVPNPRWPSTAHGVVSKFRVPHLGILIVTTMINVEFGLSYSPG